jgi:hypothetical protein
MASVNFLLTVLMLPLTCSAHGFIAFPVPRQQLVARGDIFGAGLTNPGRGDCSISGDSSPNMNGCQGAGQQVNDMRNTCFEFCDPFRGDPASDQCLLCEEDYAKFYEWAFIGTPFPHLGVCGDLWNRNAFSTNFSSDACKHLGDGTSCINQALNAPFDTVTLGNDNSFNLSIRMTAHHWGWFEFRLCRSGSSPEGVTQECFNQDILSFDVEDAKARYEGKMGAESLDISEGIRAPNDPSDYKAIRSGRRCMGPDAEPQERHPDLWSPGGSCCNGGGRCVEADDNQQNQRWVVPDPDALEPADDDCTDCQSSPGSSPANGFYTVKLRLPEDLTCTRTAPCTIQWLYITGNSLDAYPEAFRNCADFALAPRSGALVSSASAPSTSAQNSSVPRLRR